jgi:hypothetical protein
VFAYHQQQQQQQQQHQGQVSIKRNTIKYTILG